MKISLGCVADSDARSSSRNVRGLGVEFYGNRAEDDGGSNRDQPTKMSILPGFTALPEHYVILPDSSHHTETEQRTETCHPHLYDPSRYIAVSNKYL